MKKTRMAGLIMIAIALIVLFCTMFLPETAPIMGLLNRSIILTVGRIYALIAIALLFL